MLRVLVVMSFALNVISGQCSLRADGDRSNLVDQSTHSGLHEGQLLGHAHSMSTLAPLVETATVRPTMQFMAGPQLYRDHHHDHYSHGPSRKNVPTTAAPPTVSPLRYYYQHFNHNNNHHRLADTVTPIPALLPERLEREGPPRPSGREKGSLRSASTYIGRFIQSMRKKHPEMSSLPLPSLEAIEFNAVSSPRMTTGITLDHCRLYGMDDLMQPSAPHMRGDRFLIKASGLLRFPYLFINCSLNFDTQADNNLTNVHHSWELFGMSTESVDINYSMLVNMKLKRTLISSINYEKSPLFVFGVKHPTDFSEIAHHILLIVPNYFKRTFVTDFIKKSFEEVDPPEIEMADFELI
ncbi:hypothetical protein HDE_04840 [Halotydeus destructor]|nr:hypothetical protein HDE_04840 [Halotydeus destructor]